MTDRVKVYGLVTFKQDDEIIQQDVSNHWVNNGLKGLTSLMCGQYYYSGCNQRSTLWSGDRNILVGTNTTTPTVFTTTALSNPINTNPNTSTGAPPTLYSSGNYILTFIAIWNAGIITQQIGEVGLYLAAFNNITPNWYYSGCGNAGSLPKVLVSRLSVADGSFVAFTPNVSKTLTIEWKVGVASS